jgi:hypothetical protein
MVVTLTTPLCQEHHHFIPQALHDFQWQTWPELEWIIVDDGAMPLELPADPRIKYIHLPEKRNIGQLRNLCAELATGDIVMHVDADDRYAPDRVEHQLEFHLKAGRAVSGIGNLCLVDVDTQRFTRYQMRAPFSSGCSLTYSKEWWSSHRFIEGPEPIIGEDTEFIKMAAKFDQAAQDNRDYPIPMVATNHPANHSPRELLYRTPQWKLEQNPPEWIG